MAGVYSITNKNNSCVYIGSTSNSIKRRWGAHKSMLNNGKHHNKHLQHAWDKYGADAFEFLVLDDVTGKSSVTEHEQTWLDFHRMNGNVYNISMYVTATTLGYRHTKESRKRISESLLTNHPMRGKHFSEQAKINMRLGIKKHGPSFLGRQHTDETKSKISAALTGRTHSDEHRRKVSIAKTGKKTGMVMTDRHKEILVSACAKPYPSFYNIVTGEIIPAGRNLAKMCREHGLTRRRMVALKNGQCKKSGGWVVKDGS